MLNLIPRILFILFLIVPAVQAEQIDTIVAVVGDDIVLKSELNDAVAQVESQWRAQSRELPPRNVLEKQVLDRLVLLKLQLERAKTAGVQVSEDDLQKALTSIAARNNMTLNQFADAVAADGMDFKALREQIRNEVLISKLRQKEVEGRVQVGDQDVDLYLEGQKTKAALDREYHLAHILVAPKDDAPEQTQQARKTADDVLARLRAGEKFADLAVRYSNDDQALNGGDLGWRSAASLPTLFAPIVPAMKPGDTSDVIASPNGFHIVRLMEVRQAAPDKDIIQVHARHILLSPKPDRDSTATEAAAGKLRKEIDGGADFAALAKKNSDDPGSADKGGDLDWQPASSYVKEFQEQVEQMKPGEVRGPFATQYGWHIVQLIDRKTTEMSKTYQRGKAREAIYERKVAEEYDSWLRHLRDDAYVEYRLAGG